MAYLFTLTNSSATKDINVDKYYIPKGGTKTVPRLTPAMVNAAAASLITITSTSGGRTDFNVSELTLSTLAVSYDPGTNVITADSNFTGALAQNVCILARRLNNLENSFAMASYYPERHTK